MVAKLGKTAVKGRRVSLHSPSRASQRRPHQCLDALRRVFIRTEPGKPGYCGLPQRPAGQRFIRTPNFLMVFEANASRIANEGVRRRCLGQLEQNSANLAENWFPPPERPSAAYACSCFRVHSVDHAYVRFMHRALATRKLTLLSRSRARAGRLHALRAIFTCARCSSGALMGAVAPISCTMLENLSGTTWVTRAFYAHKLLMGMAGGDGCVLAQRWCSGRAEKSFALGHSLY